MHVTGSTGEVSTGRAHMEEPPSNQVGGSLSGSPGQDCQGVASEGGHRHLTESPFFPQQGWGPGAAMDTGWQH